MFEVVDRILDTYTVEIVNLTTREYGRDDFVLFGCRQNEYRVLGRLLQSFQKGVERLLRQHMDLVDDEERIFAYLWHYAHLFDK